jgi:hypothetical protein
MLFAAVLLSALTVILERSTTTLPPPMARFVLSSARATHARGKNATNTKNAKRTHDDQVASLPALTACLGGSDATEVHVPHGALPGQLGGLGPGAPVAVHVLKARVLVGGKPPIRTLAPLNMLGDLDRECTLTHVVFHVERGGRVLLVGGSVCTRLLGGDVSLATNEMDRVPAALPNYDELLPVSSAGGLPTRDGALPIREVLARYGFVRRGDGERRCLALALGKVRGGRLPRGARPARSGDLSGMLIERVGTSASEPESRRRSGHHDIAD